MTLLEEIRATFPALTKENRNDVQIAEVLSVNRTKLVSTMISFGTVLRTLGPVAGAAVLDTLNAIKNSNRALYWAWYLLEAGTLNIGELVTQLELDGLAAAGVMTADQATALKNLAIVPNPISVDEVSATLNTFFGV